MMAAVIAASAAAGDVELPDGGVDMAAAVEFADVGLGNRSAADAQLERIHPEGAPADWGFRVRTLKQPRLHYHIELRAPLTGAIRKGDTVFAGFWMRTAESSVESGEAVTLFRVQLTRPPWTRMLYGEFIVGPQWRYVYRSGRADQDIPAGEVAAVFSAGYPRQAFEVAGLEVINFGPDVDPRSLPQMAHGYAGQEPDAVWRATAEQRIDRLRKADLAVRVVDGDGRPIPGARVRVEQTGHAFWFGSAISSDWLIQHWDTPDAQRYREKITELFNGVALANQLKWARWENDPQIALRTLGWLKQNNIGVHGHVLIWPGLEKFRVRDKHEVWVAAQDDPDVLRKRIDDHFIDILTRTAGLVDDWDVINEPFTQHELIDLLGREEMVHWFKLARQYAPDTRLFLNDFGILGANGVNREKQDFMYDTVKFLLDHGAPIDAMGFQSHMGHGLTPPLRLMQVLDRFAELGLPILITEYDVTVPDPAVQEQYTRDFMTVVFSHPAVIGFTTWGFWEPVMWAESSAMYDRDWKLLPVGRAYRERVFDAWRTDESAVADDHGAASVRGFMGSYRVTAEAGGLTGAADVTLTQPGVEVVVTLGGAGD